MNPNEEVEKTLAHQASAWVTVLRRQASRAELADFAQWLKTSPRHVREFLLMTAMEKTLLTVDSERKYGLHEWSAQDRSVVLPLAIKNTKPHQQPSPRRWALAAMFGMTIVAALLWLSFKPSVYSTAVGEQRVIELKDGSLVHLNARSRLKVNLSQTARELELTEGEALFKVRRDPARPFRVHAGETVIRALGTEFNVYRHPRETTVAVLEGAVQIAATRLDAGEEARFVSTQKIVKLKTTDPARAVAWRQWRLMFDQDTLGDMIGEFNRYNKTPQFRLEDAAVANRHYTGVFDADDPESLAALLERESELTVERGKDEIVIGLKAAAD